MYPKSHFLTGQSRLCCHRLLLRVVWTLLLSVPLGAHSHANHHREWNQRQYTSYLEMPGEVLLAKAEKFLLNKQQPDSALMCFTVVAERYHPDMNRDEMKLCLEGYFGRWQTFFFGYGNAPMALEDLYTASNIAAKIGEPSAKLDYFNGVCYMTLGVHAREPILYRKCINLFRKAFHEAYADKDYRTLHRAFDNLVTVAVLSDSLQTLSREVKMMQTLQEPEPWRRKQSLEIFNAVELEQKGDLIGALAATGHLIDNVPRTTENMRYLASFYGKRSRIEQKLKRYDQMQTTLDTMISITYRYDFPDIRQETLEAFESLYRDINDEEKARAAHVHFLELRDTLDTDRFMANFQEVNFTTERHRLQKDINEMTYRSRLRGWILALGGLILGVVVIFMVMLHRKNRKLRERSEMLYRQLQHSLTKNDDDWIRQSPVLSAGKETADDEASTESDEQEEEAGDDQEKETESGPTLSDDNLEELTTRIRRVILHSPAIYEPDFTLGRLAEMVDSNRKYVSKAINDQFECNFQTLVNQARIREAMRRFDDVDNYGDYSIEGVGESVGFRSRSTFHVWFKRYAGLSALDYRRLGGKLKTP